MTIDIQGDTATINFKQDIAARRALRSFAFFTKDHVVTRGIYEALACHKCGSRGPDMKGILEKCGCGWSIHDNE